MTPAEFRGIREQVGCSIEDITRILSVSRSIVQKWESGAAPIPPGVAAAVEALQDDYRDVLEATLAAAPARLEVWRSDPPSWDATGRPARWHRQIAAEARQAHGTVVVYRDVARRSPAVGTPTDHDPEELLR